MDRGDQDMNTITVQTDHRDSRSYQGNRIARLVRPGQMLLPLAMAMCAALGASHLQAFEAKHRMMVAGIAPTGIAISDGVYSCVVSETELEALLGDVERLI